MAESSFGHGHWDNVGSFRHLRIPQNIHLYAANLRNGNSAKYFTHYAIPQSINTRHLPPFCGVKQSDARAHDIKPINK